MDTGEVAVSVRADYRGRGVGWAMLTFWREKGNAGACAA
jgi:acetyltransferase